MNNLPPHLLLPLLLLLLRLDNCFLFLYLLYVQLVMLDRLFSFFSSRTKKEKTYFLLCTLGKRVIHLSIPIYKNKSVFFFKKKEKDLLRDTHMYGLIFFFFFSFPKKIDK
jgi:hypothetical protein